MRQVVDLTFRISRRAMPVIAFALVACAPMRAMTQRGGGPSLDDGPYDTPAGPVDTLPRYEGRSDSLTSARVRVAAKSAAAMRVVVSVEDRRLWVVSGRDTIYDAPVAVGMGRLLEYGGRKWVFATPRGVRTVKKKRAEPLWKPPDWHYAEVARDYKLKLARLSADKPVTLQDGRRLVVRDSVVGVLDEWGDFAALPTDEHVVFDSTLYVPPIATKNRRIDGELGRFQLDMGNGYLLHGTPREETIGTATTHGCVRLRDEDISWLYENIPVGTKVYIY